MKLHQYSDTDRHLLVHHNEYQQKDIADQLLRAAKMLREAADDVERHVPRLAEGDEFSTYPSRVASIVNTITWVWPNLNLHYVMAKVAEIERCNGILQQMGPPAKAGDPNDSNDLGWQDASDMGLAPGEWPEQLVHQGHTLNKAELVEAEGGVTHAVYSDGVHTLRVAND